MTQTLWSWSSLKLGPERRRVMTMANVLGLVFASLFVSSSLALDLQQGIGNSSQVAAGASWDTSPVYVSLVFLLGGESQANIFGLL